jgi:hypothetical protein
MSWLLLGIGLDDPENVSVFGARFAASDLLERNSRPAILDADVSSIRTGSSLPPISGESPTGITASVLVKKIEDVRVAGVIDAMPVTRVVDDVSVTGKRIGLNRADSVLGITGMGFGAKERVRVFARAPVHPAQEHSTQVGQVEGLWTVITLPPGSSDGGKEGGGVCGSQRAAIANEPGPWDVLCDASKGEGMWKDVTGHPDRAVEISA